MRVFILSFVVGAALLFTVGATRPSGYIVERSLAMDVPPERIAAVLSEVRQWPGVLGVAAPTFPCEPAEPCSTMRWGTSGSGGTLTIKNREPTRIIAQIEYERPETQQELHELYLQPTPAGGTLVRWRVAQERSLPIRLASLTVNTDQAQGQLLESALARLKLSASERR